MSIEVVMVQQKNLPGLHLHLRWKGEKLPISVLSARSDGDNSPAVFEIEIKDFTSVLEVEQ